MKFNILLFLSVSFCFGVNSSSEFTRIINNSNMPVNVDYDVPIYSRVDTTIHPIKSQQELQDLLYEAILTNSTQAIMQVVKAGADVNLFQNGKAPLMWATVLKKFNSVETLKRCGAVIPCPKNMLYRAILNDSADDVKHEKDAGADPKDINVTGKGLYPLGLAVFLTKSEAVRALLECGATSDRMSKFAKFNGIQSKFPLEYALSMGDIKTALALLKHTKDKKISHISIQNQDLFQYLIENINPSGIKDLVLEFMQELIDRGYDINASHYNARTINLEITQYKSAWASAIYSQFYFVEVLELLMKNGANPSQRIQGDSQFWTPLHVAINNNRLSAVRFLLDAGADLTKKALVPGRHRTVNSQTPLSYAKASLLTGSYSKALMGAENQEVINLLIKRGAR